MVCPHGHGWRGVEPERTFCGQWGEGPIFCDFFRKSLMDGPLCNYHVIDATQCENSINARQSSTSGKRTNKN